ncbi:MAG TPA: ribonuclease P protein component [Stellaceae bacterium]|nr:ribonuclease P protein component [Stellaceae bacterium]
MAGIARLKRRAEFLRVAGGRRKAVTPGLILQALERPREHAAMLNGDTDDAPRVGFTASRKVGIAVARNRARRRLKAAAAQVMPRHAAPGHDYVVIARLGTLKRPFPALIGDVEAALRHLGAWRAAADT